MGNQNQKKVRVRSETVLFIMSSSNQPKRISDEFQKPPDLSKPQLRKVRYDLLYIPLGYGILIPMMRFGLERRLNRHQMLWAYTAVCTAALGHAAYIQFSDSTTT